jgi:hypothetical protein
MSETIVKTTNCTDAELPAVRPTVRPNTINEFCRSVHGRPDGWQWVKLNSSPDDVPAGYCKVEGGFRSEKGHWRGRDKSGDAVVFFKLDDLKAFEARLASGLGVCSGCWGTGRIKTRVSVNPDDDRYRQCGACGGTGTPTDLDVRKLGTKLHDTIEGGE